MWGVYLCAAKNGMDSCMAEGLEKRYPLSLFLAPSHIRKDFPHRADRDIKSESDSLDTNEPFYFGYYIVKYDQSKTKLR